ncbi:hypothetical protein BV898_01087 [Hypsibius exemplaris]|uniref:Uncharacterized protein n=1 Tax=Hypsibius exemplaris TaxID=2072580 RepID=A0A1W0XDK6_HYPEX|nr:hypothetical protein BV898_01087 [Hypsibius exemplaris]
MDQEPGRMTSTQVRYSTSLPPPIPIAAAASLHTPITGSSFTSDYPTTAQFLAQQHHDRYDYLYGDSSIRAGGGGGSQVSIGTLPYTVDGTKVIYPAVTQSSSSTATATTLKKQPPRSYASSRVSTTSELDGYPPSPSPSIPDSTFSLASTARGSNGRLSRRTHATIYLKGIDADSQAQSRSKVDLTVESENGLPSSDLHRVPDEARQQLVTRRSSSSSSSSGRGIQKLTIKMLLKEKKRDSSSQLSVSNNSNAYPGTMTTPPPVRYNLSLAQQQPDLQHSSTVQRTTTDITSTGSSNAGVVAAGGDDLPNGATAASTSYRKQLLPYQLLAEEPRVRRALSTHNNNNRYTSFVNRDALAKPRLSSSEVELCKKEVVTLHPQTTTTAAAATTAMANSSTETHIPIYERRAPHRDSTMSRTYSQASGASFRDPSKPKPYRSYERLDVISDDGGRVMREVVEELRGDHISIQVHEKGDGLSEDRAAQIRDNERNDLQRLEQTRPNLEIAMTSETDGLVLPEKPPSPGRSRREKYELYQAMAWQRDITDDDRARTPVGFHEVEYDASPRRQGPVVREETRVAESRSVSAPAPPARPVYVAAPPAETTTTTRTWYPEQQRPALPVHTSMLSSSTYSNTEHQSHISYRSIFDKCYTDERISELRKSANDLRTLANGGQIQPIQPWSTQQRRHDSLSSYTAHTRPSNTSTSTTNTAQPKHDYSPSSTSSTAARPLPPYREPLRAAYEESSRPSSYAPLAPPRGSSTRTSQADPPHLGGDTSSSSPYSTQMKSYTHETLSKTTTTSSATYGLPAEKDRENKYKSSPILSTAVPPPRPVDPPVSFSRDYPTTASRRPTEEPSSSFAYKSPWLPDAKKSEYVPYVSSSVGITSLPRTTDSYGRPKSTEDYTAPTPPRPHLSTVEAIMQRSSGKLPLPRDFIKDPVAFGDVGKNSLSFRPRDPVTSSRYESNTTSTSSTFEKPKMTTDPRSTDPRSTGSSWAYGHKLPDEQYRSTSAERPDSRTDSRRDPPLKTVEPAVLEALRPKKQPEMPTSPDVRPKDWVPPCKAKILQAKRKYMNQQPVVVAPSSQDPWDRFKSASRERVQLRISRESLDAINKEATRGRNTRMSAPDLSGSMKTLTNPGVYRSKIHWPEREVQAKLSESQEYLSRRYQADYSDDPTTSSFANRWDARSRSLPPMSRYSKSAATTPSETPYPEYMDSSKAKSMEFLADVKKFDYQIVPENQLQRENISGYARPRPPESEPDYSEQVRKSLQKLDIPEWYTNSAQYGNIEPVLRHRAHSTTDSTYSPYATLDRSELTSPTGTAQYSDAQTLSRRPVPYRTTTMSTIAPSKPALSTSRENNIWDMYSGPHYDKKPRPAAIYAPASDTHHHRQAHYNPHDSGWSSDWNSHHDSSLDSDESTTGEAGPRAWGSNAPKRGPAPFSTSTSSAWYVPPLQRKERGESPSRVVTRSHSEQRPAERSYRQEAPPYVPPARPSTYFDPSLSERRILQATPWEVTSIKTETIKTEKLAKKNFVTETNDPVRINQFSQSNNQWGSFV